MLDFTTTEQLFKNHYRKLCHFAWQLLDDKNLVEDIVQDAFVSYWNDKQLLSTNESAIRNYLYSAVRHACYNVIRREKIAEKYRQSIDFNELEEEKVLSYMLRSEVMDEIHKALKTLPEGCQQIFRLGYLDGLSNLKISESLGISINTVKTQKQRGLKMLKAKLSAELFTLLAYLVVK